MKPARRYQLRKRADQQAETHQRIIEATVELHRTLGPAATQINEIARRAGVQRVTVYAHFPDEAALLAACSSHWRSQHPAPSLAEMFAAAEPRVRIREALRMLYGWYRETEPMTANVLRDAQVMPALRRVVDDGLARFLSAMCTMLAQSAGAAGRAGPAVEAAARVVADFNTWRLLSDLSDEAAAELGARFLEVAAAPDPDETVASAAAD